MTIIIACVVLTLILIGSGLLILARAAGGFKRGVQNLRAHVTALPVAKATADAQRISQALIGITSLGDRCNNLTKRSQ